MTSVLSLWALDRGRAALQGRVRHMTQKLGFSPCRCLPPRKAFFIACLSEPFIFLPELRPRQSRRPAHEDVWMILALLIFHA